jgi:hypothetical protein
MATTTQAATLTAAEQRAQQKLGVLYAALALRLWQAFVKPEDIDGPGYERLLELLIPQITKARGQAARNGRVYYEAFRILETGQRDFKPAGDLVTLDRQVIETSIRVTGPVAYKERVAAIKSIELEPAVEKALLADAYKKSGNGMAAAMMRHVIDGARHQVLEDHKSDPVALGYMRMLKSTEPCYFCAMLASRGPVYKGDSFARSNDLFTGDGPAKAHDHCACTLEPVFSRETEWTPGARDAAQIWGTSTAGKGGRQAIAAFRKAWESRSDN